MKQKLIITVSCFFLLTGVPYFFRQNTACAKVQVTAQKTDSCLAGVYLTYDDFKNNRLSYKVNTDRKGNSFGFILNKTIKIITPSDTVKLKMGSIYGFNDCSSIYRYSPDVEFLSPEDYYKIEEIGNETNKLTIYTSVFYGWSEHFFSTGLNAPIHRLNIKHLEKDFGGIFPEFIKEAKKLNKDAEGLDARDEKGHFLINELYQQYVTK